MLKQEKIFGATGSLMAWGALVLQLVIMLQRSTHNVFTTLVQFFSYYTILTNLLVAVYFTTLLLRKPAGLVKYLHTPSASTGVALHITVVGLVYQLLLRNLWNPQGAQLLADNLLHAVIPLYFILYWILLVPKQHITYEHIAAWLLYPVVYLMYTLIHGALSGFYPYPFVDAAAWGYQKVFTNSAFFTLAFMGVGVVFVTVAQLITRFTQTKTGQR